MKTQIEFTRISNDVNGNPRYVCHFFNLITESDKSEADKINRFPVSVVFSSKELSATHKEYNKQVKFSADNRIDYLYKIALWRAHKIGGRKFSNKQYGGGIVFQSYNIKATERNILELLSPATA